MELKRQIIALTNDADRLGETYIFPGYERPGSRQRSFSANTSNPKILLDRLDETESQPRGDKLLYLGTQMTPGIDIVTNPAIFDPALLIAGAMDPSKALLRFMAGQSTPPIVDRLANKWRGFPLNIVAGDYINEFGFCEAVIKHNRNVGAAFVAAWADFFRRVLICLWHKISRQGNIPPPKIV